MCIHICRQHTHKKITLKNLNYRAIKVEEEGEGVKLQRPSMTIAEHQGSLMGRKPQKPVRGRMQKGKMQRVPQDMCGRLWSWLLPLLSELWDPNQKEQHKFRETSCLFLKIFLQITHLTIFCFMVSFVKDKKNL